MIHNLCKLLYNPLKREMLVRIYTSRDGVNVGALADEMCSRGLVPSGVSQYLKELEGIGIIRRSRAGRYVNYYPSPQNASSDVRLAVKKLIKLKIVLRIILIIQIKIHLIIHVFCYLIDPRINHEI